MDLVPDNDVLSFGSSLWWIFGEYTQSSSKKLYLYRCFNVCIFTLTIFSIVLNLTRVESDMYIKEMEGTMTAIHVLLKYCFCMYHKPNIIKILKWKQKFWDYRDFDRNVYTKTKKLHDVVDIIQKFMVSISLSVAVMYSLRPLFDENKRFVFDCWAFGDSIVLEAIALFSQYYLLTFAVPILFGYDCFYIGFCMHMTVQLRILRYKLKNIQRNSKATEIYEYVEHHQLLLLVFTCIKNTYYWMLMFHYAITLFTSCSQLYVILVSSTDTPDLIGTLIYISGMLVQFAYYSIPAEEMVFELRSISVSAYMSIWYQIDVSERKTLLIMMMKSQQQRYLSAGGMIDMNVHTFGSVIRKTFSFYAILRNVLNK